MPLHSRLAATSEFATSSCKFFQVGDLKTHINSILPGLSQNLFSSIYTLSVSRYWERILVALIHQLRKEMYVQLGIISILMVLNFCQQIMTPSGITWMLNRNSNRVEFQGSWQRGSSLPLLTRTATGSGEQMRSSLTWRSHSQAPKPGQKDTMINHLIN